MRKIIIAFSIFITIFTGLLIGEQNNLQLEELINVKVVGQTETDARVVIETTGEVKFHVFKVTNPSRLVVEMVDVVHKWPQKELDVSSNLIKQIRSGQYKDMPVKITRVVIDMAADEYTYREISTQNQITIALSLAGKEAEKIQAKKEKEEKKKPATKKRKPIERNVQAPEHKEEVAKILTEKRERELERKERLARIKEIKKPVEAEPAFGVSLSKEPVDFNFKDAEILEILRGFAIKFNKNIIPSASVSGKVTLRLKQVPFDEAFKMLLEQKDLVAVQTSPHVISVVPESEMPTKRVTYHLNNRTAPEMQTTLQGLLTSEEMLNTKLAVDNTSNALIVTANTEVLSKISSLVEQLDIKSPQIRIRARLLELSINDDFQSQNSYFAEYINSGDIRQVVGFKDEGNFSFDDPDPVTGQAVIDEITVFGQGGVGIIDAIIDNTKLVGVLNILKTKGNGKTISEPTILTENNKSAKIHVGQNLPVQTTQVTETGTTQSVEYIQEGVDLEVTPVVSPGSAQISLSVDVSVSNFVGFQANNPITSERSANTEITIATGKTAVIGGLISESVAVSKTGIPILMDIPILGYFFRNHTETKTKSELIVFLTPEILAE